MMELLYIVSSILQLNVLLGDIISLHLCRLIPSLFGMALNRHHRNTYSVRALTLINDSDHVIPNDQLYNKLTAVIKITLHNSHHLRV